MVEVRALDFLVMRRAVSYLHKTRIWREPHVFLMLLGIQIIQWRPIEPFKLPIELICNLHGLKLPLAE